MAKKPETLFKERVLPLIKALPNTWAVKIQQVAIRGTPDIIACVNGHFVAIELKTDIGKIDKLQQYTLGSIKNANGLAYVVSPKNWDDLYVKLVVLSRS